MNLRPLLLGFTVPDDLAAELFAIDPMPAVQTHRFAWSLARSLKAAFGEVRLLSTCPVQDYPLVSRLLFRRQAVVQDGIRGVAVGFVNFIIVKHVTRLLSGVLMLPTLLRRWRVNIVFVHGTHTPWLFLALILRLFGLPIVHVLTDLPGVALPTDRKIRVVLKAVDRALVGCLLSGAAARIALAPDLIRAYPSVERTLVFPGILSSTWQKHVDELQRTPPETFTVVYAGGVSAAYGVDLLLEAALLLPDVKFLIIGTGDQVSKISGGQIPNVNYLGFLPPNRLAQQLLSASVLINPRPSVPEFSRSSFPSKLLEYLSTGLPVLTTRISSIPEEIEGFFSYIEEETPQGIANAIVRLRLQDPVEIRQRAEAGQRTVIDHYSEEAIGLRVSGLLAQREGNGVARFSPATHDMEALCDELGGPGREP